MIVCPLFSYEIFEQGLLMANDINLMVILITDPINLLTRLA